MPRVVRNGIHGVLLLDKPPGLSSNVALQRVRRLFGWAKAGHTGTLDPLATGLLPVCLGEATKFSHALLDADKSYETVLRFGHTSSTGDAEGEIRPTGAPAPSAAAIEFALAGFLGIQRQVPPMHSALKRDGRPLYEYARQGQDVPREAREIVVHAIELVRASPPDAAVVRVRCSKGTYVRVLGEDIGRALGCGAYLLELRRTGIADLDVADAMTLERLEAMAPDERPGRLLPMDRLLQDLPSRRLDADSAQRVRHGLPAAAQGASPGLLRLYDPAGGFLGLGEVRADGALAPRRLVSEPDPATKPPAGSASKPE
ncbi:MAG TPA: tRNA pseudouridine(55) synthase TruB [Burkholderiales bacterium]|jgi:tRNA pseudouridine55 synthase|nr:tRNA pseudouridine(55) synthase TruB [Burkholderiales bacterium]